MTLPSQAGALLSSGHHHLVRMSIFKSAHRLGDDAQRRGGSVAACGEA